MLTSGDMIPDASLIDGNGARVKLDALLQKPLVLYFYPKDNTPGCTVEACGFRDAYDAFVEAGAEVIGVSSDNERSHSRFREKHNLPYRLMSDTGGAARRAFGVPSTWGILPGRATFVIGRDGRIIYAFNSQFTPDAHVKNALAALIPAKEPA
jgi:thioredoxin-dependent peroxiredoxin